MSVIQAMRKGKSRRERGPAWHRATTRTAILEAARNLIAEHGLEDTSLIRVAEKTGFAPTTVYAYFVRKADLISAIVADDLARFARSIVEGFECATPEDSPDAREACESADGHAPVDPAPEPDAPVNSNAEAASAAPEIAPEAPAATAPDHEEFVQAESEIAPQAPAETLDAAATDAPKSDAPESDAPESETPEAPIPAAADSASVQVPSTDAITSAFEARIAQLEARRADPWLERRLREFERMLAALEERIGAAERGSATTALEGRVQELTARFETYDSKQATATAENAKSLAQDLDAREARQRQSWSELRTLSLELSGRLDALERDRERKALAVEMPVVDFAPKPADGAALSGPAQPAAPVPAADESYLAAARRAAQTAETLAQTDDTNRFGERIFAGRSRTRLLLAMGLGLGVVLAGASMVLHERAAVKPGAPQPAALIRMPHAMHGAQAVHPAAVLAPAATPDTRAETERGLAYLDGKGSARSDADAGRWLSSAANAGDPVAQYWLATLYEHGRGVPVDPATAIRWYEAAALQGNLKATYKLAVSYAEGWGTRQNYSEAARWFSRAAELGFVNAQFNLGVLYERGLGVPQSLLDAYKWYALAAAQGDRDSAARIEALSSQLSAEDLATAREAVAAFRPERAASASAGPSTN